MHRNLWYLVHVFLDRSRSVLGEGIFREIRIWMSELDIDTVDEEDISFVPRVYGFLDDFIPDNLIRTYPEDLLYLLREDTLIIPEGEFDFFESEEFLHGVVVWFTNMS